MTATTLQDQSYLCKACAYEPLKSVGRDLFLFRRSGKLLLSDNWSGIFYVNIIEASQMPLTCSSSACAGASHSGMIRPVPLRLFQICIFRYTCHTKGVDVRLGRAFLTCQELGCSPANGAESLGFSVWPPAEFGKTQIRNLGRALTSQQDIWAGHTRHMSIEKGSRIPNWAQPS